MNVILGTVLLIQASLIKQLRSFPTISLYVYGFASTNNPDHRRSFSKNKQYTSIITTLQPPPEKQIIPVYNGVGTQKATLKNISIKLILTVL
jgi:hypothetical protein